MPSDSLFSRHYDGPHSESTPKEDFADGVNLTAGLMSASAADLVHTTNVLVEYEQNKVKDLLTALCAVQNTLRRVPYHAITLPMSDAMRIISSELSSPLYRDQLVQLPEELDY